MPGDKKMDDHTEDLLKALNHEMRRRILRVLIGKPESPISPREVAGELRVSLSNVSYHVRVLADCAAISLVKTNPVRGSLQHFYSPSPEVVELPWVATVLETPSDAA
jgi:DNA-binding transcriptional ArsR family regulator